MKKSDKGKYEHEYTKIAIDKSVEILRVGDIKREFPEYFNKQDFLEYIGRKLFFSGFLNSSVVFFNAIGGELDPYDCSLMANAYYHLDRFDCAYNYYQKAADGGYARSYYWLGRMHQDGLGVSADEEKAYENYLLGAQYDYVLPKRAYLKIDINRASLLKKIMLKIKLLSFNIKVFFIIIKDAKDERLADLPIKAVN